MQKHIPEYIFNKFKYISINLKDFLGGMVDEEDYIKTRKDSLGRVILQWPELIFLKMDMGYYADYLLKFSLYSRRMILMEDEIIGFSQQQLYSFYGISHDTIRRYLGKTKEKVRKKHKPKIRDITRHSNVAKEVVSFLAILSRVPFSWVEEESPEQLWTIQHFSYLDDSKKSLAWLKNELEDLPLAKSIHDVRGIIINQGVANSLYLRIEWVKGGLIIEVFNPNCTIGEIVPLIKLLQKYNYAFGYMDTVITTQKNFTFIINLKNNSPICLPMEFKSLECTF
ncbi:hypothetical protein [Rossellomorea aquimaris]|uniref:hypothetical protein n=1 Tax=Rossellomorea aquimaris TaxID=189382 RepID=UPI000DEB68D7|nr:hypothetical protein [Rossellomorea aquimaris]